jgi:hypothetical protein
LKERPAPEALLDELAAATQFLGRRQLADAASALGRASSACDALAAAGVALPREILARARALHADCEALAQKSAAELAHAFQRAGTSRRAAQRYVRGGLR